MATTIREESMHVGALSVDSVRSARVLVIALGLLAAAGPSAWAAHHVFGNADGITIPALGDAVPYPSNLTVSGLPSQAVVRVQVVVSLTHSFPRDVDMLVQAPSGERIVLMADVGGNTPVTGLVMVFDDCAASSVPLNSLAQTTRVAYRPTGAGPVRSGPPLIGLPAPTGHSLGSFVSKPFATALNGVWSLYVRDDSGSDAGQISSWGLFITTGPVPVPALVCGADGDGDGFPEFLASAGPGGGPHIQTVSGRTGSLLGGFLAYDPGVTSGVRTAACDFNADGIPEIITVPGPGGAPHVRVFDGLTGDPLPGTLGSGFFPYDPGFVGGAFLACDDFNLDGVPDIVVAPGPGGGPHVRVFDGRTGQPLAGFLGSGIFAYDPGFTGGVFLAP
jgi:hypothetical protein